MSENCFTLVYPHGEEVDIDGVIQHYPTAAAARREAKRFTVQGWGTPTPDALPAPCVTIRCQGCGCLLDEPAGEGVQHFESLAGALEAAGESGWTIDGDTTRCPDCTPRPRRAVGDGDHQEDSGV